MYYAVLLPLPFSFHLRIIQNGGTRKKFQCHVLLTYSRVLRSGKKICKWNNWGGYKAAERHISYGQIYRPEIEHQRLKGVDGTITKSSRESCESCMARFVRDARSNWSFYPCSLQFWELPPCYSNDNSNLVHWTLWQRFLSCTTQSILGNASY
jgi:hypothetical protein